MNTKKKAPTVMSELHFQPLVNVWRQNQRFTDIYNMTNLASHDVRVKPHSGLPQLKQYIPYSLIKVGNKTTKRPHGSTTNPNDWLTYGDALTRGADGVGFVFTDTDPYFFIDIDHCLIDGAWSPLAVELCQTFAGCYVEISQSGTGLHIIGSYSAIPEHACKNVQMGIELYHTERFVALTGSSAQGSWEHDATGALNTVIARYFPKEESTVLAKWTNSPQEGSNPIEDDTRLIEKACSSKGGVAAVFGGKATFKDLWNGVVSEDDDRSSLDSSLATRLLWWTGGDCERTKSLMLQSGLKRDKWFTNKSYLERTILNAAGLLTTYYSVGAPIELVTPAQVIESNTPIIRSGYQFVGGSQFVEHFKGCVYIIQQHRMMTPSGVMYRPEQFNAAYGGYVFALDDGNGSTTRKAFEAFTESQFASLPKVDSLAFRPELPQGKMFTEAGVSYVNCYVPTHGERAEGDVTPFLNHVQKLIPDEGDRKILLTWIASCIQNPGKKHQWSPVLVGAEGNGKSLVAQIVKHAIGKRWVAEPRSNQIGGRFNSWIENKLFAVIEEIHMNNRRETLDTMKPLITNTTVEVEGKGRDSYDAENRCNILMCTNYKDAVIKTRDDRRYAIIYTGQHSREDKLRDGMDDSYFASLYTWLQNGGYAAVANWFDKYTDVSCNVMGVAPQTSSTDAAIIESLGGAEQDIIEAVELEKVGFRSGLISLLALDHLLNEKGHRLQTKRKAKVLTDLGYIKHPSLPNGRIKMLGSYVRVYVKKGHPMESAEVDVIRERLTSVVDIDPTEHFGAAK